MRIDEFSEKLFAAICSFSKMADGKGQNKGVSDLRFKDFAVL